MANFVTEYMSDWLDKTYKYLKESGGGPVRPPATTGINVLPTGPYSVVGDPPGVYYTTAGTPIKFNPADIGLAPIFVNKANTIAEIAKENPAPEIVSGGFLSLYGAIGMKGCLEDQIHSHNNPNAQKACEAFAQTGNTNLMILAPYQKNRLGIIPAQEQDKPDDVQIAEDDASLTGQVKQGAQTTVDAVNAFLAGATNPDKIPGVPGGGDEGEGGFFQAIEKGIADLLANIPGIGTRAIPWNWILIGGGAFGLLLLMTR